VLFILFWTSYNLWLICFSRSLYWFGYLFCFKVDNSSLLSIIYNTLDIVWRIILFFVKFISESRLANHLRINSVVKTIGATWEGSSFISELRWSKLRVIFYFVISSYEVCTIIIFTCNSSLKEISLLSFALLALIEPAIFAQLLCIVVFVPFCFTCVCIACVYPTCNWFWGHRVNIVLRLRWLHNLLKCFSSINFAILTYSAGFVEILKFW